MTSPIPSPLPEGWRVVTARTQAECDAAFAVRCRLDTILVIEPRESIDVKIGSVLFGNRGGLGSINGEIVRFYGIRWLIVQGGESPVHPDWIRSLQRQAEAAGVPFAFLSWGSWMPCKGIDTLRKEKSVTFSPEINPQSMLRVGPSRSGRSLDGREWSQVPEELRSQ